MRVKVTNSIDEIRTVGNKTNDENSYGHSLETTQTMRTATDILWKQHEQWEQLRTFSGNKTNNQNSYGHCLETTRNNENSYGHSLETRQTIRTAMAILCQVRTGSMANSRVSRAKSIGWNNTLRRKNQYWRQVQISTIRVLYVLNDHWCKCAACVSLLRHWRHSLVCGWMTSLTH